MNTKTKRFCSNCQKEFNEQSYHVCKDCRMEVQLDGKSFALKIGKPVRKKIIQKPNSEKRTLFECMELLNELKAATYEYITLKKYTKSDIGRCIQLPSGFILQTRVFTDDGSSRLQVNYNVYVFRIEAVKTMPKKQWKLTLSLHNLK